MKFSVAMCTYNGARFLREQLDSIAAQTRPPDELVVCDDRSTDGTTAVVEAFAASAPFPVRLHVNDSEPRLDQKLRARRRALRRATSSRSPTRTTCGSRRS